MSKILVGINNLTVIGQPEYANHIQLFYRLGRSMLDHDFGLCNPSRMSIDRMRNFSAAAAMEGDFEYLVFIDDDVLVPFNSVQKLLNRAKDGHDVIAGVTHIRSYPYWPMIFDFSRDPNHPSGHYVDNYKELADETGLLKCDAVGFSLCMIKVSLLKKMVPPFFVTGANFTEDVYFCGRAKEQVSDVSIVVDTTIETGHQLSPEFIMPSIVEARRNYDVLVNNAKPLDVQHRDRAVDYFKSININLGEDDVEN